MSTCFAYELLEATRLAMTARQAGCGRGNTTTAPRSHNLCSVQRPNDGVGVELARRYVPRGYPTFEPVAFQSRHNGICDLGILRPVADEGIADDMRSCTASGAGDPGICASADPPLSRNFVSLGKPPLGTGMTASSNPFGKAKDRSWPVSDRRRRPTRPSTPAITLVCSANSRASFTSIPR